MKDRQGTPVDPELVKEVFRVRAVYDACFLVVAAALCFWWFRSWPWAAVLCVAALLDLTYFVFTARDRAERVAVIGFYLALFVVVVCGSATAYLDLGLVGPDNTGPVTEYRDSLYFSVVTWTTLGYGDIRPGPDARLWAAGEVLFGYIYMGLFLAFVVQALGPGQAKPSADASRQTAAKL